MQLSTLDPQQSLAFSIPANPGVYALLLGSGVSRAAGIPTGWDIVVDLLGKLAGGTGGLGDLKPEDWYRQTYGEEPEYSRLIGALAKTSEERQQLLRPYFEPDERELELGLKQPTAAHRAIAQLVVDGYIRVIITTNFDRLIETALLEAGVTPTVLSTPDQVAGALPLIHTKCCVFKVHGDYLDPRILNSLAELNDYHPELDRLLDQIFDQFGLIVCGWSAEWDIALRNAITRAPSRRFTVYWTSRGALGAEAEKLVEHRNAEVIQIEDADTFFREVEASVSSIAEFSRPHPWSTQAAVATLKRFMSGHEHRIQHADHIDNSVKRLVSEVGGDVLPMRDVVTRKSFVERIRVYESASSVLLAMAMVAGYWAEDQQFQDWDRAVRHIYDTREVGGDPTWTGLRNYPAYLVTYALGFGAVASERLPLLGLLFDVTVNRRVRGRDQSPILVATHSDTINLAWDSLWPKQERRHTPRNDRIHDVLREPSRQLLIQEDEYSYTFDKLEILISLNMSQYRQAPMGRFPIGCFLYRHQNRERVVHEIRQSLESDRDRSPFVVNDLFGSDTTECLSLLREFEVFVARVAQAQGIW